MAKNLPDAALIRAPNLRDFESVMDLIRERDLAVHGGPDLSEEELRADWATMDLGRDARLASSRGGEVVGYATVSAGGPRRIDMELYERPDATRREVGSRFLLWAEHRAKEMAVAPSSPSQRPPDACPATLQSTVGAGDVAARGLLEGAGYALARGFFHMESGLGEETPEPVVPEGLKLHVLPGHPIRDGVSEAVEEAFRDHWGQAPGTLTAWAQRREAARTRPAAWLAATAGEEVAGAVFCEERREDGGLIEWLAVRRPWRRRGLGLALLLGAFLRLRGCGARKASLVVDSESPTGATRLYERAGMRAERSYAVYRKELPPDVGRRAGRDEALRPRPLPQRP